MLGGVPNRPNKVGVKFFGIKYFVMLLVSEGAGAVLFKILSWTGVSWRLEYLILRAIVVCCRAYFWGIGRLKSMLLVLGRRNSSFTRDHSQ